MSRCSFHWWRSSHDVLAHGVAIASTGTHPWSRWQDQRIIDTPHYRLNDEILRYVVWRNNSFGIHVHVAVRGADRAVAVCNAFRNVLPELLAFSASSPFVEDVVSGMHSVRNARWRLAIRFQLKNAPRGRAAAPFCSQSVSKCTQTVSVDWAGALDKKEYCAVA